MSRIDTSSSPEVAFPAIHKLAFTPIYNFTERSTFYITIQRGAVRGTEGCDPGNEPINNKTFWTFETLHTITKADA